MEAWGSIEARQLLEGIEQGTISGSQIIDVREFEEWDYYHLPGTTHVPMRQVPGEQRIWEGDAPIYLLCAHGVRSEAVCRYLAEQGVRAPLWNVEGGMAAVAACRGFAYD
ncbi:rhodanese-like domain-containing protein [Paenibacillus sp. IB182496]|uniref:Rhodanese-like domain-containing protein n=1 Tax=Paenibacillus sabuli TaxID=2772509 RepID=A0A927BTF4_9BACL|nr:rhodanese-like domain-containing protein [Paenibacillus sabuli]MBD2845199.1 rhodanese-like domain-containing protein [Paenibacillus sabuli]